MSDLDGSGYSALAAPLVFVIMGGEAWVNQWQGREHSGIAVGHGNLSTALVVWLACIGALLDQRPHAWRWEATRWATMGALFAALLLA